MVQKPRKIKVFRGFTVSKRADMVKVTIPEGYDLEYIAAVMSPLVGLTAEDLLMEWKSPDTGCLTRPPVPGQGKQKKENSSLTRPSVSADTGRVKQKPPPVLALPWACQEKH